MSEEEIDKMVKEAEANAEADKKKREGVDVKNQADTMIHSAEKNLKNLVIRFLSKKRMQLKMILRL